MKFTRIFLYIFSFAMLTVACSEVDDLLTFNIRNSTEITVPSASPFNLPFDIPVGEVATNSSQEFENNNTAVEYVKNVSLKELDLSVVSPKNQNFDFLKSIHLYISTNDQDEVEVAFAENIPKGVTSVEMETTGVQLDKYIKAPKYNLRSKVVVREINTQDVKIQADLTFKVTANILK